MRDCRSWKLVIVAFFAGLLALTASPTAPLQGPSEAHAAISIAYTLEQIVDESPMVIVAKATDRRSVWEEVGDSKRIVTYTRLKVVDTVYGKPGKTLWVRTLGGVVGKIGQSVAGEAHFAIGKESVVFLTRTTDSKTVVTGAAQGHFPIVEPKAEDEARKLTLSPNRGKILPPRKKKSDKEAVPVQKALLGVELSLAIDKIREAKAERDAARKKNNK